VKSQEKEKVFEVDSRAHSGTSRMPLQHLKPSQLSRITIQIKHQPLPLNVIRLNLIPWETFQISEFPNKVFGDEGILQIEHREKDSYIKPPGH
jgi:hypothetical protein